MQHTEALLGKLEVLLDAVNDCQPNRGRELSPKGW